jgi:hypothetical protein
MAQNRRRFNGFIHPAECILVLVFRFSSPFFGQSDPAEGFV